MVKVKLSDAAEVQMTAAGITRNTELKQQQRGTYRSQTPERREMLDAIGVSSLEDLIAQLPAEVRLNRPLDIADGKSEARNRRLLQSEGCELRQWLLQALQCCSWEHNCPGAMLTFLT